MATRRPVLHLKSRGLVDPEDDRYIELAVYDVLLPCRKFLIDHKVAVLGRTSLTTEFLLRLVKAVPGISEGDAAAFFGFNVRETSFVLAEAETPGYVERRDGRLWLTAPGDGLFRDGSSEPEIFVVEPKRREVGFDLISIAPERPRFLTEFELGLPELAILDDEAAGSAAAKVPQAFRRFFAEIADRRERNKGEKKDLYSVDPVTPKNRFLSTVRIVVRAQDISAAGLEPVGQRRHAERHEHRRQNDQRAVSLGEIRNRRLGRAWRGFAQHAQREAHDPPDRPTPAHSDHRQA